MLTACIEQCFLKFELFDDNTHYFSIKTRLWLKIDIDGKPIMLYKLKLSFLFLISLYSVIIFIKRVNRFIHVYDTFWFSSSSTLFHLLLTPVKPHSSYKSSSQIPVFCSVIHWVYAGLSVSPWAWNCLLEPAELTYDWLLNSKKKKKRLCFPQDPPKEPTRQKIWKGALECCLLDMMPSLHDCNNSTATKVAYACLVSTRLERG